MKKHNPRWVICTLWVLVGLRLVLPFSFESEYAFSKKISVGYMEDVSASDESAVSLNENSLEEGSDAFESKEQTEYSESFVSIIQSEQSKQADYSEISEPYEIPSDISENSKNSENSENSEKTDNSQTSSKEAAGFLGGGDSNNKRGYKLTVSEKAGFSLSRIWLAGTFALLLYGFVKYLLLKRKVSVFTLCENGVRKCEAIDSPFVLGVFSPEIYLPFGITAENEEYIIKHEKAHIKRFDHLSKIIAFTVLSVHWFNPFVWVAFILYCKDIECACDEKVVKELDLDGRKKYAKALLECSIKGSFVSACPVAFGEIEVKERVKNTLYYKKPLFWSIVICLIVCVVLAVVFFVSPKDETDSSSLETELSEQISENSEETSLDSEESATSEDVSAEMFEHPYAELLEPYKGHLFGEYLENSIKNEKSVGFCGIYDTEERTTAYNIDIFFNKGRFAVRSSIMFDHLLEETVIYKDGKYYLIDHYERAFSETKATLFSLTPDMKFSESFTKEIDGALYDCERYETGYTDFWIRGNDNLKSDYVFCFKDGELAFFYLEDVVFNVKYYDELPLYYEMTSTDEIFIIPEGYTEKSDSTQPPKDGEFVGAYEEWGDCVALTFNESEELKKWLDGTSEKKVRTYINEEISEVFIYDDIYSETARAFLLENGIYNFVIDGKIQPVLPRSYGMVDVYCGKERTVVSYDLNLGGNIVEMIYTAYHGKDTEITSDVKPYDVELTDYETKKIINTKAFYSISADMSNTTLRFAFGKWNVSLVGYRGFYPLFALEKVGMLPMFSESDLPVIKDPFYRGIVGTAYSESLGFSIARFESNSDFLKWLNKEANCYILKNGNTVSVYSDESLEKARAFLLQNGVYTPVNKGEPLSNQGSVWVKCDSKGRISVAYDTRFSFNGTHKISFNITLDYMEKGDDSVSFTEYAEALEKLYGYPVYNYDEKTVSTFRLYNAVKDETVVTQKASLYDSAHEYQRQKEYFIFENCVVTLHYGSLFNMDKDYTDFGFDLMF